MTLTMESHNCIAALNDRCRQGFDRNARIVITRNCLATLTPDDTSASPQKRHLQDLLARAVILAELRKWKAPEGDNSERDMGWFDVAGHKLMFKIDYYDPDMKYGSEDPADAAKTTRVLTIMLPSDY